MAALGCLRAGRRTRRRSILLQGLVVNFHLPPFRGFVLLVEAHHSWYRRIILSGGASFLVQAHRLAAVKCSVAGHQIQKALAAAFVCKDLLHQKQRKRYLFQIHLPRLPVFERLDCLKARVRAFGLLESARLS